MAAARSDSSAPAVLVVGAGFTGAQTVERFASGARPVRLLSRRPHPELAARLGDDALTGDASDAETCARALDGCDTVVWCAGKLLPTSTPADLATTDDVSPLVTMLRALAGRDGARFVFLSSGGTVYGKATTLPVPETEPPKPLSVYASVKVLSERWVDRFRANGVDATILRAANVYGPTQPVRETQGVIARAMRCALDGEPFPMIGTGESIRDYLYLDDLVDVIEACVDGRVTAPVVNVGSGIPTSLEDLVKMIDVVAGGLEITSQPTRPSDLHQIVLDISLLRSQLADFEPTPLPIGLERTWSAVSGSRR
jgi:UDP-glucose 4-epimerase